MYQLLSQVPFFYIIYEKELGMQIKAAIKKGEIFGSLAEVMLLSYYFK